MHCRVEVEIRVKVHVKAGEEVDINPLSGKGEVASEAQEAVNVKRDLG